jgi:cerevisin
MRNILVNILASSLFQNNVSPKAGEVIDKEYIVMLKKPSGYKPDSYMWYVDEHIEQIFTPGFSCVKARFNLGYGAVLDDEMYDKIKDHPDVEFIEKNQWFSITDIQKNPKNWGLKRISGREEMFSDYYYPHGAGEGVYIYIVDTGVMLDHPEFGGRAIWGFSSIADEQSHNDLNGHGTHVASTVAGSEFGVAKKSNIIAVKVLRGDGYGTTFDVIRGIEFVTNNHKFMSRTKKVKAVANMSIGGGKSYALERALEIAITEGIQFTVAAGNSNTDACNSSPSASLLAITVGSTERDDRKSYFSNWGKCVDIFAPGSFITAAWNDGGSKTISGTSMASPHVCGVIALILGESDKYLDPGNLKLELVNVATTDILLGVGVGSPNRLLYTPFTSSNTSFMIQ